MERCDETAIAYGRFHANGSNAAMEDQSVEASMLIRRPPGEVFAAFVNPQTLRKFWLSDASGPLAPGARVQWQFMVPGATAKVAVTALRGAAPPGVRLGRRRCMST